MAETSQEILSIGTQCKHPSCFLVDFLPFKCDHCKEQFCQEHFRVSAHQCPKYDEFKHDRVAPNCPFCQKPVTVKQGQDPNERLEQHFTRECSVYAGKSVSKSPVCNRPRCGKVLFSPIQCDKCNKQFCAAHRFPADHSCTVADTPSEKKSSTASGTRIGSLTAGSRLLNLGVGSSSKPGSVTKPMAAVKPTPVASKEPSTQEPSSSKPIPFSKTNSSPRLESPAIQIPTSPPSPISIRRLPQPIINITSTPYAPPPIFAAA